MLFVCVLVAAQTHACDCTLQGSAGHLKADDSVKRFDMRLKIFAVDTENS